MNGILGNTLNKLSYLRNTLTLIKNVNNDAEPNRNSDCYDFLSVSLPTVSESYACFVCSVFSETIPTDASTKYFFIVNSLTSTNTCTKKINITLTKPNDFVNYRLENIEKGVPQVPDNVDISSSSNISLPNSSYPNFEIPLGEGYLYKYGPVVKIGGTIVSNETINSATTLNDAMTIATGCTLTINSTYTINNDITLEGSGKIQFGYNGNIVLNNGARIINSTWSSALLRGNATQKPKLIWSPYTGSGTVTGYEIYRQFETSYFDYLASTGANQFSYTDQTITIAPENMSGPDASYYVKAVFADNTKSAATNTVSVMVYAQKKKAEKEAAEKSLEFKCDNYPNPFNPTTTISYQIPSAEKVTLKIFDVLGKEVVTLVDTYKEAGSYHAVFDASKLPSGVYIYRLEAGENIKSSKMILTK